jgi:glucose-6-phosphate 1-dehydrogenase
VTATFTPTPGASALMGDLDPHGVAPPCALVVFGASGDLCARKLLPALERLARRRALPGAFAIVGVARSEWDDDDFRAFARDALAVHGDSLASDDPTTQELLATLRYVPGDYADDGTFRRLTEVLDDVDRTVGTGGNRLHYLALPASVFPTVVAALGRHRLDHPPPDAFVRLVVEKPYGHDLASARQLDESVLSVFDESQVYRIDHYLGKETVQNLLALRFANAVFEPVWNRRYVDSVQITVAERDGVGHRADSYEQAGALRDIVQNHVLQVLALTLMEPPISMDPDGIRDEKVKALRAVESLDVHEVATEVVRGQYTTGWIGSDLVPGYHQEPGVSPTSMTETYVALRLLVDNWRWAGVPFYVRTGKRLPKRVSEVAIRFQAAPHLPFGSAQVRDLDCDTLVLRIQPDDGVALVFGAKVPGHGFDVRSVAMEFLYGAAFPDEALDAYERLLLDAMIGDATLFIRGDEVMEAWRIVDPMLRAWESDPDETLAFYEAGTWGPKEADRLLEREGRRWRRP